ncbi:hypothetical protein ACFLS4_06635, partial [Bacteroidota bacterium]
MRISKIKIKKEFSKRLNLKEIDLTKRPLGNTVALIGKNGAGKSRILKLVEDYIQQITYSNILDDHFQNIPEIIIKKYSSNIKNAKNHYKELSHLELNSAGYKQKENQIMQDLAQFLQRFKQLGRAYVKVVDNDVLKDINKSLESNNNLTFEQILSNNHFENLIINPNLVNQSNNNKNPKILLNEFNLFGNATTVNYIKSLTDSI